MEIASGFEPEKYGWKETKNRGSVAPNNTHITEIRNAYQRGRDTVHIARVSPTRISSWSKNGTAGEMTLNAFMRAIK